MPYIPHTPHDTRQMLEAIGISSLDALFAEIPSELICKPLTEIPPGLGEMAVHQLMQQRAAATKPLQCFLGAGAYEHHIPSAVWDLTMRGEFLTAYTPYQAEASQGSLQLLWEYQTMMASLMGLDVSNASLYEGASALAEAALMGIRLRKDQNTDVWVGQSLHPHYRETLVSILATQGFHVREIPYDDHGLTTTQALDEAAQSGKPGVLVISQPNSFGQLEDVNALTDWGRAHGAIVVGVVNPLAMALLKPPGQWGQKGVDIACGEGHPLGVPLASGGPYFGFLCCRKEHVRQLPGRLVGRTVDKEGNPGFTLTLQAREQHIRRAKATSNICTNQGFIGHRGHHLHGPVGTSRFGKCGESLLGTHPSIDPRHDENSRRDPTFKGPCFHETAWRLPLPASTVLARLSAQGINGGLDLASVYPQFNNALLVCVTETKSVEDIHHFAAALQQAIEGN